MNIANVALAEEILYRHQQLVEDQLPPRLSIVPTAHSRARKPRLKAETEALYAEANRLERAGRIEEAAEMVVRAGRMEWGEGL